jgi:hypothetical protein
LYLHALEEEFELRSVFRFRRKSPSADRQFSCVAVPGISPFFFFKERIHFFSMSEDSLE